LLGWNWQTVDDLIRSDSAGWWRRSGYVIEVTHISCHRTGSLIHDMAGKGRDERFEVRHLRHFVVLAGGDRAALFDAGAGQSGYGRCDGRTDPEMMPAMT
jgi:hypothetical protein